MTPSRHSRWTCKTASTLRAALLAACGLGLLNAASPLRAADWPTYRHDAARSGITAEGLSLPLAPCWTFRAPHAPQPAWGDPKPEPVENILELRRVHFDDVFQPVAAGGSVYFGSSADNKVYCLDAATGKVRWTRITGGPVRLAPAVAGGRLYVGSDDGCAYCLRAVDGGLAWKFRAAPDDRRVLGHGKMISLWPLRTGVLVDAGTAYFGAGVFPAEGVFLYAVDAGTGRETWRNDACGEDPQSRVSPQGYLLASASALYVPMGRVSPATFSREDGRLVQSSPFLGKTVGGTYALLAGQDVFTGTEEMVGFRAGSRDRFATFPGRQMVVTDDTAFLATDAELVAMERARPGKAFRWKRPCADHDALILAGDVLLAGGDGRVVAFAADSGNELWHAAVEGRAKGLAVADGRLLVSTDRGAICCFGPAGAPQHGEVTVPAAPESFTGDPGRSEFCARAAETILAESGARRGYCLVLGIETGQLAHELAKQSELMIYAVSPDADKVAAARQALDAAGCYGARVCVEQWPLEEIPYADYFANLVVSETALLTGKLPARAAGMARMLKPLGGTAIVGQPDKLPAGVSAIDPAALKTWAAEAGQSGGPIGAGGTWAKVVRGALPGAGSWTHEYANAGNTACGDDQRLKAPLGVLWFGNPGPAEMVNRHSRAAGPLALDGRLFIQGENVLMAYDAYNGLELWRREIRGAMRVQATHDTSNLAAGPEGLFVAVADKCLRLDPATGRTLAEYPVARPESGEGWQWGYVALQDGLLVGSATRDHRKSDLLFAIDASTGAARWTQAARQVPHNTIAISQGRLFYVCDEATPAERRQALDQSQATAPPPEVRRGKDASAAEPADAGVKIVACLDAQSGRPLWRKAVDLAECAGKHGGIPNDYGVMAAMADRGALVLFGVYLDGHYWRQFFAGQFDSRRITALAADDGRQLWSRQIGFRVRPLIVGDTLYAEPWALDLATGQTQMRQNPITGEPGPWQFARPGHHCGCPAASPHCLFFRSYTLGYYDLDGDYGTVHFGGLRPGCWINFIPAGGLLLMPEASAGCMCPFPNMCSIALKPVEQNNAWAYYSATGGTMPVRRLALNLGAPGDRRDRAGNLWLGCPRPGGSLVLPLKVEAGFYPSGRFAEANSARAEFGGTDDPWLYASAADGLRKLVIPLVSPGDGKAVYRVRLAMADPDNDRPGRRVFDIKLQGAVVAEDFDPVKAAGGRRRATVQTFDGVAVDGDLVIELEAKAASPGPGQLPLLQAVEVDRQRIVELGCLVGDFCLSVPEPRQSHEVKLANLRDAPFVGRLLVEAPPGLEASPRQSPVELAAGQRAAVPVEVRLKGAPAAGRYPLVVKLVRQDGSLELVRRAAVEHLGRRGRKALPAVADAHVIQRMPDRTLGAAGTLLVDGGDQKMGDGDHAVAYLRFRIDVPGRPVKATLRITDAGNPTGDAGRVCLVEGPWDEGEITYGNRPALGKQIGRLGKTSEDEVVECPLDVALKQGQELGLAIDPTSCDGVDFLSRESGQPAELVVEYEP